MGIGPRFDAQPSIAPAFRRGSGPRLPGRSGPVPLPRAGRGARSLGAAPCGGPGAGTREKLTNGKGRNAPLYRVVSNGWRRCGSHSSVAGLMKVSKRLGVRKHLLRFLANIRGCGDEALDPPRRRGPLRLSGPRDYLESGIGARISLTAARARRITHIEGRSTPRPAAGQRRAPRR